MKKLNHDRRQFLVATAAGAAAGVTLLPEAKAQPHHDPQIAMDMPSAPKPGVDDMAAMSGSHGAFFKDDDARTVAALTERLMPGEPGKPGATEVGVLNYIDLALSGAYSKQQDFYRRGIAQLDRHCMAAFGKPFRRLSAQQQDDCITAVQTNKAPEFEWPTAPEFFETIRTHTMEGMFADPVYGGNKGFAGWRLVGFPGAQPIFTPDDLQSKDAFAREPIMGLQSRAQSSAKKG